MLVMSAVGMSGAQYESGRFSISKSRMRRPLRSIVIEVGHFLDDAVERPGTKFLQAAGLEFMVVLVGHVRKQGIQLVVRLDAVLHSHERTDGLDPRGEGHLLRRLTCRH